MTWPRVHRRSPIGIDVSGRYLTAVQLSGSPRAWRVEAAASVPRLDPAMPLDVQELSRLGSMLYRQGFHGDRIVISVPPERLVSAVLDVEDRGVAAARPQLARAELAGIQKCEPQALEAACWALPKPTRRTGTTPVIAVACRQDEANAMIDLFEAAGLDVLALDVTAWAAARAVTPIARSPGDLIPVLNLGWAAAELVVVAGGLVVYERVLPEHGMNRLHSRLTAKLSLEGDVADHLLHEFGLRTDIDEEDANSDLLRSVRNYVRDHLSRLTSELAASLSYTVQEYRESELGRLLVHGEGALIAGLDEHLSSRFGQETTIIAARDFATSGPLTAAHMDSPLLLTALGLAQHREH